MVEITKIKGASSERVSDAIKSGLKKTNFDAFVSVENPTKVKISDVRLSDEHLKKYGYNISPYTGRRGRILGWNDWVKFNNMINDELDKLSVSANAHSLKGKFKIRQGKEKFTESDWEGLAYQNVGSVINPVSLKDAWVSEGTPKKKLSKVI